MTDRHDQQAAGTHPAPCARHCEAPAFKIEVRRLEAENKQLRAEVARQHEEILHLRIYAPGQHQAHVVKPIPRIGPTDWRFYGLELAEADFDSFGYAVPNETEL